MYTQLKNSKYIQEVQATAVHNQLPTILYDL